MQPTGYKPIVHQIWVGKPIPKFIANLCNTISQGCTSAGWEYKLWDWPMLKEHFADDPLTPELDRLIKLVPMGFVYAMISDYYRLALMAEPHGRGTLYLDTDFILVGEEWPEFPCEADLYYLRDWMKRRNIMQSAFWLPPGKSVKPFIIAYCLVMSSLHSNIITKITSIKSNPRRFLTRVKVDSMTGPGFITYTVADVWHKNGTSVAFIPQPIMTHSQWLEPAALQHLSLISWGTYN